MNPSAPAPGLALFEPDVAGNADAMLRTCACPGVAAPIVERIGFPICDRHFRRGGLACLGRAAIDRHLLRRACWRRPRAHGDRLAALTARASRTLRDVASPRNDVIIAGGESADARRGAPGEADARIRISMCDVACAAARTVGEAMRQLTHAEGATG